MLHKLYDYTSCSDHGDQVLSFSCSAWSKTLSRRTAPSSRKPLSGFPMDLCVWIMHVLMCGQVRTLVCMHERSSPQKPLIWFPVHMDICVCVRVHAPNSRHLQCGRLHQEQHRYVYACILEHVDITHISRYVNALPYFVHMCTYTYAQYVCI